MLRMKAKVGQKGQAVIPKAIRDEFGIKPGDEVYYSVHGDHIHVDPRSFDERWDAYIASLPTMPGTSDLDVEKMKRLRDEQYEEEFDRFHQ